MASFEGEIRTGEQTRLVKVQSMTFKQANPMMFFRIRVVPYFSVWTVLRIDVILRQGHLLELLLRKLNAPTYGLIFKLLTLEWMKKG
tara:strand:- start:286 stop:546 length:261 start_codon:yes stop_codon:yes gene_type:complete